MAKRKAPPRAWKKGQTGNINGRPKKEVSITATILDMMAKKPEIKKALATKIFETALKGDMTAIKTLWSYVDGMPLQKSEITGLGGNAIEVENKWSPEQAKIISHVFKTTFEEVTKRK